jgi:hypothetical protein
MPDCMLFRSVIALSINIFVYASVASWCAVPRLVFDRASPACSDLKESSCECVLRVGVENLVEVRAVWK